MKVLVSKTVSLASAVNWKNFSEGLLADLKQRLTDWDQFHKIADIIVTKGPFLKMYSCYIRDFEHQCKLLDEACANHPLFAKAVQEFEASDICCKLSVKHYMLKPVQRIPQYRLLFQSYIKLLPTTSPDTEDAQRALAILEDVATHANDTCKIEDKVTQLLSLQRRLYLSDGRQPELIKPGREVLRQGELMKLCRRGMQPRYFVLLSDGLLYTSYTSSGSTMLRLNTELPLEGMKVSKPIADDFSAELTIRATQRSFTLSARSEQERDEWLEAVQNAIDANIVRRSTFFAASTAGYVAPSVCELGKQAPVWVPDYRVTMCQICTAEFSLTFRRHHCRACGKVVCDLCSSNRAPLEYKKNHAERVCDSCYEVLLKAVEERIQSKTSPETDGGDGVEDPNMDTRDGHEDPEDAKFFKREPNLSDLKKIKLSFKKGIRDSMRGKSLRKPERLLEVSGNDQGSQMRGYLRRQGRRGWYVLKERVLYQYAAPEDVCAIESLPVLGYTLDEKGLECPEPSFTLQHPNQDDIVFVAENGDLALKWVAVMREATVL